MSTNLTPMTHGLFPMAQARLWLFGEAEPPSHLIMNDDRSRPSVMPFATHF